MLERYNNAIEKMILNDSNSSIDTLLKEVEFNLLAAYELLKDILNRLIEDAEDQEKIFYIYILNNL